MKRKKLRDEFDFIHLSEYLFSVASQCLGHRGSRVNFPSHAVHPFQQDTLMFQSYPSGIFSPVCLTLRPPPS